MQNTNGFHGVEQSITDEIDAHESFAVKSKPKSIRDKKIAAAQAYSKLVAAERLSDALQYALGVGLVNYDDSVSAILANLESL